MADIIVVDYEADMTSLSKSVRSSEKDIRAIEVASKKSMKTLSDESKKSATEVKKVDKSVNDLSGSLNLITQNLPFASAIGDIQNFGSAINQISTSGASSLKGLGKAMIALPIFALIAGFTSLLAFFKRTDEGATRLEGVMGGVGAAVDIVTGSVAEFGSSVFESFSGGPLNAIKDFGQAVLDNIVNRFTAVIPLFRSAAQIADGDFKGALKSVTDAGIQLATGIENGTDKIDKFNQAVLRAAKNAYDNALAMDAINDAQRENSLIIEENIGTVQRLIIASKAKDLSAKESIALLQEANRIEAANLKMQLDLEERRLAVIKENNIRELESINQGQTAQTQRLRELQANKALAKSKDEINAIEAEEFQIKSKLLSINDDLANKERAQEVLIQQLKNSSVNITEKNENRITARIEQGIQEEIEAQKHKYEELGNIQHQAFLDGTINAKELNANLQALDIEFLQAQREILLAHQKDVTDVNKAILDIQVKAKQAETQVLDKQLQENLALLDKTFKAETNLQKEELLAGNQTQEQFNRSQIVSTIDLLETKKQLLKDAGKDTIDIENQILDERLKLYSQDKAAFKKKEDEKKAATKETLKAAFDLTAQSAQELGGFLFDLAAQQNQEEQKQLEDKANQDLAVLQKQKDAELISEAEFNARKQRILDTTAQKEAELKRKQAQSDKAAALFDIAIATAVAIAKASPIVPLMVFAGITGALQAALVAAKPIPKFKDGVIGFNGEGTETSDSNIVAISNRESIMTAKATSKYKGELTAMHEGNFDRYVNEKWIEPAIREAEAQHKARARRNEEFNRAMVKMNTSETDLTHLENLTKKNRSVKIDNTTDLARAIAREMNNGIGIR